MKEETITLGGGCFWCVEAAYQRVPGVVSVESGYAGGASTNPTYDEVCSGASGHAEVVQITFDSVKTDLATLLKFFWVVHDPTTLNRQGADIGTQYRSVIYYRDAAQKAVIDEQIQALEAAKVFSAPIVTEVSPLPEYFSAEAYHQNYYNLNPTQGYCAHVIAPKLEKLESVVAKGI